MNFDTAITTQKDLYTVETSLVRETLVPMFNPDHLPKALAAEGRNLYARRSSLERELEANHNAINEWANRAGKWFIDSSAFGPEDFFGENGELTKWSNYYAAVVTSDVPLLSDNALLTAPERDPFEQRILATSLLTGTIKPAKKKYLEERSATLLSSRNPRDVTFFSDETLAKCLAEEGLTDAVSINRALGRIKSTYIKPSDRREALWLTWTKRADEQIQQQKYQVNDWGDDTVLLSTTFTAMAWMAVTGSVLDRSWNPPGATTRELRLALFAVIEAGKEHGLTDAEFYLDPLDEDCWDRLATFTSELKKQPFADWYVEWQDNGTPGQTWMREFGIWQMYGAYDEWFENVPDKTAEDLRFTEECDDPAQLCYGQWYRDSKLKDVVQRRFGSRLEEVIRNA